MSPSIVANQGLASSELSLWSLFWNAHLIVQGVMLGLLICSVWVWAIAIDKTFLYARMRRAMDRFEQAFWSGQSLEELYAGLSRGRTLSMAALFVAAFAAALPGAALHALFSASPAIAGRVTAGRLAAIEAVQWLVPAVPALATAALFVCAKADQDPVARETASGFGGLIRAAMAEAAAGDRLASCALLAGGLALLSFLGHRFVVEARAALGAGR